MSRLPPKRQHDAIMRTNWGYWDGVAAAKRGRFPSWSKGYIYRGRHPFDQKYAAGFWIGFYGEPAPPHSTGDNHV